MAIALSGDGLSMLEVAVRIAIVIIFCVFGYATIGFGFALLYHLLCINEWLPESEDIEFIDDDDLAIFIVFWPFLILAFVAIGLYLGYKSLFIRISEAMIQRIKRKRENDDNSREETGSDL